MTELKVVLLSLTFTIVVGVVLGLISGFVGGWLDRTLVLVMDALFAFPYLLLAIVVAFFTSQTLVALAGFTLMVVSATALAHEIHRRGWSLGDPDSGSEDRSIWPRRPFGRR